jgi:predicted metal-dependent hydrolase
MQLPLTIRRKAGVKRLTLRLSRAGDEIVVTAPRRASTGEIRLFVDRHRDWVAQRVQALPGRIGFTLGWKSAANCGGRWNFTKASSASPACPNTCPAVCARG